MFFKINWKGRFFEMAISVFIACFVVFTVDILILSIFLGGIGFLIHGVVTYILLIVFMVISLSLPGWAYVLLALGYLVFSAGLGAILGIVCGIIDAVLIYGSMFFFMVKALG